jgi:RecA-family ATPase
MSRFKVIDLHVGLRMIEYVLPDLIARGTLTFVAAREGAGKTTVLTSLAWQMSRPNGQGRFLGWYVAQGRTLFINTDAPDGESRPVRFWLEKHKAAYPDGDMDLITVVELDTAQPITVINPTTGIPETKHSTGLSASDVQNIKQMVLEQNVTLIILDSFMGAFPGLDPNRLELQMKPLQALVALAAETGAALVVTDHLPKRAAGEQEFERGIIGSVAKTAQARAVHMLSRLEPKDCDGLDMLRWVVQKSSFAKRPEPFGVNIIMEETIGGVLLERCELPDSQNNSKTTKALLTISAIISISG